MKICLCRIIVFCAMLSFASGLLAQTASLSPTLTTATCAHPACTWKAFGPVTYMRLSGEPRTVTDSFAVLNPDTQFTLHIDNDGVASAVISINGIPIFGPSDFDPHFTTLDRAVTLRTNNAVAVELRGKPGASLTITVVGVDNDPPSIIELAAPLPNAFGWINTDVQINFSCSDATSGIASCPNSLFLTNEGLNQIISGTAFDRAGNSSTATIQVSIDKTPPTIAVNQSPAANSAGWNNSPVTVNFTCADALSGIASCPSNISVSTEGVNQQVSGTAVDRAGNSSGTSMQLNIDQTPPVIGISAPANGATATTAALQITGTVSDNLSGVVLVSCNGAIGVFSGSVFTCNVSLVAGANAIQVQATDNAGNVATTQITVTLNANPPPPPKSILITPSTVNMLIGDARPVKLVGDIGQAVIGATWSISDPTVVSISSADLPQLTALGQGTTTLTATFNGLTAVMTINVLPGTALPAGTALWAFDPLPDNTITQMVPGNPVNAGDPDIFAVEAPNTLRAFTKDGLQLWAVSVGGSSAPAATLALPLAIQQQNVVSTQPKSLINPFDMTQTLGAIPAAAQDILRKHGAFDSLDLMFCRQRLIERQRHRASPRNASGTTVSAALLAPVLMSSNAAASDLMTLLIKAVPDNSGGVINLVETFTGCCAIIQTSFIKIDTKSREQIWRRDFTGAIDENFAIGADSTVYSSQLVFPAISNAFAAAFGTASSSNIFALDGDTGEQKFSILLPPGHFKLTNLQGGSTAAVLADVDLAAQPGPLSILPDGSINVVVYTNHLAENFQNLFLFSGFETAVSDHKTLQLLTAQADGSFRIKSLQSYDFDAAGCMASGCKDPGAGYIPNEVIPDGQGGVLASWTGNDTQLGITSSSAALVRHFDSTGGMLDYAIPFVSLSWSRIGGNNPQSLLLGESTATFATDGQSIIAFDMNSGVQLWDFVPSNFQGSALLGATAANGITALELADFQGTFDANPNALLAFDSSGVVGSTPLVANNSSITYLDPNTLLGVDATGQGEMLSAAASFDPNAEWLAQGNVFLQRATPPPRISYDKQIVKAGISKIGKDVRGVIKATIKPKSAALNITFRSTNIAEATVAEDSRVDGPDSTTVVLRVTGIDATSANKPGGDTFLEAVISTAPVGPKIPILVVVPTTQDHMVSSVTLINIANPGFLLNGQSATEIRTKLDAIAAITIQDQFNQTLDALYDGNGVVTEQFDNTIEQGLPQPGPPALPTTETVIAEPNSVLTNGKKLDSLTIDLGTLIPGTLNVDQIQAWQNGTLFLTTSGGKFNNTFSFTDRHVFLQGRQEIRVHGFAVTPRFVRTQEAQPSNHPPIPYRVSDTASIGN